MSVKINSFNEKQRYWYACLLAKAALADNMLHYTEKDYFYKAFHYISEKEKKEIYELMREPHRLDEIFWNLPMGFKPQTLLDIYVEVVRLVCSDGEIYEGEQIFLNDLKDLFEFSDGLFDKIKKWSNELKELEKAYLSWKPEFINPD